MANKYSLTLQLQLQSPQNVSQVVSQLQKQLGAVAVNVKVKNAAQATQQIQDLTRATNNASNAAAKLGDAFGVSLKRFAAFSLASRAIGVFTRNLAGAINSAIDFQNELVKISQITGEDISQLSDLSKEVTRLATTFGVASNEILGVTNILAQAGLKANDLTVAINTLTKTKLAPTFGDIQDTTEGAVALIAQFGQGVGALERQLGSINRVAAEFAVESEDLIEVVRRTGGVFKASGGNLEELLALFTSVRATTREGAESIATALKTIFTRIQRPETIQYLRQFGVELTDLDGKFVGPFEAVRKLSAALKGLGEGDIKFIEIAEELGGYRQIGKVIPLLQQFETAERARQVALEAGNSLNEDAAKAQQSLAVQFTKTRESFLALIRGVSETSTFQVLVKTSLNLANSLIKVADALKPIIPLVSALAAVKFASNIGSFFGSVGAAFTRRQFGGPIHKFASGGLVPGSGNRDTVPAMLTPGEFVIRKSSVNKLGAGTLAAMNENRYEDGGRADRADRIREAVKKQREEGKAKTFTKTSLGVGKTGNRKIYGEITPGDLPPDVTKTKEYGAAFLSPDGISKELNGYIDLARLAKIKKISDPENKYKGKIGIKYHVGSLNEAFSKDIENTIFKGVLFSVERGAQKLVQGLEIPSQKLSDQEVAKQLRDVNIDNIIGNIFEGIVTRTGVPYTPEARDKANATFDYPQGLGKVVSKFQNDKLESIQVDAKTRYSAENINSLLKKAESDIIAGINKSDLQPYSYSFPAASVTRTFANQDQLNSIFGTSDRLKTGEIQERLPEGSIISDEQLRKLGYMPFKKNGDPWTTQTKRDTYWKKVAGAFAKGGAIQRFAVGSKGTGVKPLKSRKAYVFDFDDTLAETEARVGAEPNNPDKFSQFRGDLAAKLIDSGQATKIAAMAKKRAQLGHDIYVLTARPGEPQTVDAISRFMQRVGAPAKGVIGVGNMFAGEREPGKRPGTTRLLTTGSKKAKILSQIAPNYDQTWFLDDAVENLISGKQVAGVKTALADTKGKNIVKRFAAGGAAPSDTVPALLTPGEFVFSKKAAQSIGYGALNRMNKHGVAGYAKGGPVAVQKFQGGGQASTSSGGGGGFNLLSDKASQLAFGFSLLSGTLGGTETAFQKTISSITSLGASVSSAIAIMNAFGVSKFFDLQKIDIKKIFGAGKGGLGDIVGGYIGGSGRRGLRTVRRTGESFTEGFSSIERNNRLRQERTARANRLRELRQQSQESGFRGFSARADLLNLRRQPAISRLSQPQSIIGKAGEFLGRQAAAGGKFGQIAGLAGRGISAVGAAGSAAGIGGLTSGLIAAAGPLAAVATGLTALNSVVGNLISAETKYQQAIEKGSAAEAQKYAVLKEVPGLIALFGEGLSKGYISLTSWFTGKTVDSIKAKADAELKAARFTNEFAENEKKASKTLKDAEIGTISFIDALNDVNFTANLKNAQASQAATEKSIRERDKAERAGIARDILTLGGTFGQTSTQYNANLDKENLNALNESIKKSREEFDKLAPAIAKANEESFAMGKTDEEIVSERLKQLKKTSVAEDDRNKYFKLKGRQDAFKTLQNLEEDPTLRKGTILRGNEKKGIFRTRQEIEKDTTLSQSEKDFENQRRELFNLVKDVIPPNQYKTNEEKISRALKEYNNMRNPQELAKKADIGENAVSAEDYLRKLPRTALLNILPPDYVEGQKLTPEQEKLIVSLGERIKVEDELRNTVQNQRKAYEENLKYLQSLNFGLSEVSARANAASVSLQNFIDQSETGAIKTEASIKTLEAALSKSGQAISKESFKTAQADVRNVLQQFGAGGEQIKKFDDRTTALFTARKSLKSSLESIKNQTQDIKTAPEDLKQQIAASLEKDLKSANIDQDISREISKAFTSLNLDSESLFKDIKTGDLNQLVENALSPLEQAFIDQIKPIVEEYNQQQKILVDLTKQRVELEKSLAESTKRSIDIELESRKAIEEFGGPVVKTADKLDALNRKISQDLKLAGVRGVTGGSATEISRTQAEIQSRFRVLQSQQDAALKAGQGTAFGGIAGVDEDKRTQLRDAQESLIEYTRNRIDLIREEIDLAKKKNELEKSAIDKLVSGDIEGFLKDQQASAAANVLRFGDQDLAKLFTPTALGAGLQSLQGQGLSDKEIERAYRTALMPIGGTERMAQVGAGTTPELEALKREGRDLASVLNETGQGIVEMDTMTVNAKTIQIMGAQDQLNQFRTNASAQIAAIQQQSAVAPSTAGSNVNAGGFNANAAATAINAGMAVAGGPLGGIATGNITNLTDSLNRFYESANILKDLKLTMKLDTTNVNVNFNGAGFLENLTNEVRTGVLKEVLNTIKREMKLDSEGRPTFPNI